MESVYIAISNAAQVMDSIEGTINKFLSQVNLCLLFLGWYDYLRVAYTQQYIVQQVEKVLYLITELSSTLQNQDESLEEMEKTITVVAKLVVSLVELLP